MEKAVQLLGASNEDDVLIPKTSGHGTRQEARFEFESKLLEFQHKQLRKILSLEQTQLEWLREQLVLDKKSENRVTSEKTSKPQLRKHMH